MRKSLKDISWLVDEPTYRADTALSYSNIKRYAKEGFSCVRHIYEQSEPSAEMRFGSLLDCLLTDPARYQQDYYAADIPELSDSMAGVLTNILERPESVVETFDEVEDNIILQALIDTNTYQNDWRPETKINKVRKACTDTFNLIVKTRGKEVISLATLAKAEKCRDIVKDTFPEIFSLTQKHSRDGVLVEENWFQLKFKAKYLGIPIRCMTDAVRVDHNRKEVTITDLKTSHYPEYEFFRQFIQMRYDIQAEEYWWNVRQNMDKDDYFKDFKLNDFQFVVVNPDNPQPLLWVWERSKIIPDGSYGSMHTLKLKPWTNLVTELNAYIESAATMPNYIDPTGSNSLIDMINTTYL